MMTLSDPLPPLAFGAEAPWTVIGDPSQLYVCSDAATDDLTPICAGTEDHNDALCARAWRLAHTVVHGSSAPSVALSREAYNAFHKAMVEAIDEPLAGDMWIADVELWEQSLR